MKFRVVISEDRGNEEIWKATALVVRSWDLVLLPSLQGPAWRPPPPHTKAAPSPPGRSP